MQDENDEIIIEIKAKLNVEFDDNEFDIVLCIGSLSYVDYEQTFKEVARVTKKDGTFFSIEGIGQDSMANAGLEDPSKIDLNKM